MKRVWHDYARDEYLWWQNNDRKILKRISKLIEDIVRGNSGLGKPERLKETWLGGRRGALTANTDWSTAHTRTR